LESFEDTKEAIPGAVSFICKTDVSQGEFFIPLESNIDAGEEKERLSKELEYNKAS